MEQLTKDYYVSSDGERVWHWRAQGLTFYPAGEKLDPQQPVYLKNGKAYNVRTNKFRGIQYQLTITGETYARREQSLDQAAQEISETIKKGQIPGIPHHTEVKLSLTLSWNQND